MSSSSYEIEQISSNSHKRAYHRIAQEEKKNLIHEVFANRLSISKASRKLGINNSTAKVLIRKYKLELKKHRKQQKDEIVVENHLASIQQHVNNTNQSQISTPILFFVAPSPPMAWGYDYPFSYPLTYFSCMPKFD